MVSREDIEAFVDRIVDKFRPERVILFGSYAYGSPTADSDVDLLVIMPHREHSAIKAAEIRKQIRAGFPVDLVVRSPREIRRRLAMGDAFIGDIVRRGQPLYDV